MGIVTGVNPAGDAGDTSAQYFGWGTSTGISPQYYYVLSDIAVKYWLPSVRSASSRFHSAIRRHQFASVRQADSRLTRLVPQPSTRVVATGNCSRLYGVPQLCTLIFTHILLQAVVVLGDSFVCCIPAVIFAV